MTVNIQIISPAFYAQTVSAERRLRYFSESAERHGVRPLLYGVGRVYADWIQTHINEALIAINSIDASHVLFTDSSDVMFLAGMKEIEAAYEYLGRPSVLMSVERVGGEDKINFGGWLMEREIAKAVLTNLRDNFDYVGGDPQERMRELYRIVKEPHRMIYMPITLDVGRKVFQVVDEVFADVGSPYAPCLLHFAGGYSDPVNGRAERMEPVWKGLGYDRP